MKYKLKKILLRRAQIKRRSKSFLKGRIVTINRGKHRGKKDTVRYVRDDRVFLENLGSFTKLRKHDKKEINKFQSVHLSNISVESKKISNL